MKKTDIAWAAGFYEGEGYCGYFKHKNGIKKYCHVSVKQVQKEPLAKLQGLFGGYLYHVNNGYGQKIWMWVLFNTEAEKFIKVIRPWLSKRRKKQSERPKE